MSSIVVAGDTSGSVTLSAPAVSGSSVLTLPVATDTLVGKATTDTLTNKTLTSPILTTPALGTPASGILTSCTGLNYDDFKNRIINGGMVIDQRNAGASVSVQTSTSYLIDRWLVAVSQSSKFSVQQNAGAITSAVGFGNYLGVTSASSYTVLSGDYFIFGQYIEGFNFSDMAWGTASASAVTLSFKVYSSLTGTFGGSLQNSAFNRSYPFTYSIPTANTWTTISVTVAGDTSGTWIGNTNGVGLRVWFSLGMGTTYSGTANAWVAGEKYSATGATSVVGTNGATFYITGVQLEKGSTATSFNYRPYGTELALCQRYYVGSNTYYFTQGYDSSYTTINSGGLSWDYQMRVTPSISIISGGADGHHSTPPTVRYGPTYYGVGLQFSGAALRTNANGSAYVAFTLSAEL